MPVQIPRDTNDGPGDGAEGGGARRPAGGRSEAENEGKTRLHTQLDRLKKPQVRRVETGGSDGYQELVADACGSYDLKCKIGCDLILDYN